MSVSETLYITSRRSWFFRISASGLVILFLQSFLGIFYLGLTQKRLAQIREIMNANSKFQYLDVPNTGTTRTPWSFICCISDLCSLHFSSHFSCQPNHAQHWDMSGQRPSTFLKIRWRILMHHLPLPCPCCPSDLVMLHWRPHKQLLTTGHKVLLLMDKILHHQRWWLSHYS